MNLYIVGDILMGKFLNVDNSEEGFNLAMDYINRKGNNIITEEGQLTREYRNMFIEIKNPLENWPFSGSWKISALNNYADQLINFSYDTKGFDYMYNERMGRQIYYIIKKLKENLNTRQATAYLWLPEKDLETKLHKPCQIVADYKFRDNVLYATHFFRSHDIKDAWPQNVYGLAKLQKYIANEINKECGSLTTISVSAHIYI